MFDEQDINRIKLDITMLMVDGPESRVRELLAQAAQRNSLATLLKSDNCLIPRVAATLKPIFIEIILEFASEDSQLLKQILAYEDGAILRLAIDQRNSNTSLIIEAIKRFPDLIRPMLLANECVVFLGAIERNASELIPVFLKMAESMPEVVEQVLLARDHQALFLLAEKGGVRYVESLMSAAQSIPGMLRNLLLANRCYALNVAAGRGHLEIVRLLFHMARTIPRLIEDMFLANGSQLLVNAIRSNQTIIILELLTQLQQLHLPQLLFLLGENDNAVLQNLYRLKTYPNEAHPDEAVVSQVNALLTSIAHRSRTLSTQVFRQLSPERVQVTSIGNETELPLANLVMQYQVSDNKSDLKAIENFDTLTAWVAEIREVAGPITHQACHYLLMLARNSDEPVSAEMQDVFVKFTPEERQGLITYLQTEPGLTADYAGLRTLSQNLEHLLKGNVAAVGQATGVASVGEHKASGVATGEQARGETSMAQLMSASQRGSLYGADSSRGEGIEKRPYQKEPEVEFDFEPYNQPFREAKRGESPARGEPGLRSATTLFTPVEGVDLTAIRDEAYRVFSGYIDSLPKTTTADCQHQIDLLNEALQQAVFRPHPQLKLSATDVNVAEECRARIKGLERIQRDLFQQPRH